MLMIFLQQELCIAEQHLQLEVGQENQLIEEGPGYLIIVGDLRHFPLDALVQPSPSDTLDTGVGISIWASGTLHRVASGWWGMSMHRHDSVFASTSYYHQRFPVNCQLVFERCQKVYRLTCGIATMAGMTPAAARPRPTTPTFKVRAGVVMCVCPACFEMARQRSSSTLSF